MTISSASLPAPAASLQGRDLGAAVPAGLQQRVKTEGAETGRAVAPAFAGNHPAEPRLDTFRDRPVGPPPAFAMTLLQHLHETAFDPPETKMVDRNIQPATSSKADAAVEEGSAGEAGKSHSASGRPDLTVARLHAHDRGFMITDVAPAPLGANALNASVEPAPSFALLDSRL